MRYLAFAAAALVTTFILEHGARADGTPTAAPPASAQTLRMDRNSPWGDRSEDSSVTRARDLLARARLLDEAATADDKAAIELAARLPTLRTSAKAARDRADRASGDDRETLVSRAEDLEAELAVSEAEATAKRRSAAENRRAARDLRTRAVRMVREAPTDTSDCDPPYRFSADGRMKIYRIECLSNPRQ